MRRSMITVLLLTITLAIGGSLILDFFKVSIFSLQIGGGILLMVIAIDMLGGLPRTKAVESGDEIAVVPIATPLLAYLLPRYSELLIRVLGINGIRAISRFMTIIIAAFAAQLLYGGFTGWMSSWGFI